MDQHLPESDITSAVLSLSPPNLHTEAVTASPVEIFVRAGVHITDHPPTATLGPSDPRRSLQPAQNSHRAFSLLQYSAPHSIF